MKKLKTKIFAGLGFLFLLILLLSIVGIVFINQLSNDSSAIIRDNYVSVDYSNKMLKTLDNLFLIQSRLMIQTSEKKLDISAFENQFTNDKNDFDKYLSNEENNITEKGEKNLVENLKESYNDFLNYSQSILTKKSSSQNLSIDNLDLKFQKLRSLVQSVYEMNMQAILRRNQVAGQTASRASNYMGIIAAVSFILTFFVLIYFPNYIISPINELTIKIKEIAKQNYDQRINLDTQDELGELAISFNQMSTRLKEYEGQHIDQLLLEKKRIEALVKSMQDGVLVIDEQKHIILTNKTFQNLIGISDADMIGEFAPEIAKRNELLKKIFDLIADKEEGIETDHKPIKITLGKEDQYYKIEIINITRKLENSSQIITIGNVILLKNITQFEVRDLAKTNLIATVSHELKTPISSINLSLNLLDDKRIGETNFEQKKLVESIRHQNKKLLNVVNELLDFSQVETGNIRLKFNKVEPEQIIELATFALMMMISQKNIHLKTIISDNLPLVNADVEKSVWVLVNILNNAIRYSPKNGIITISAISKEEKVFFSVKDEGPGISEQDKVKVFEKYVTAKHKNYKGTGLGLAIAKEFVESQKGRIWVESELGDGSTFTFTLPIVQNKINQFSTSN